MKNKRLDIALNAFTRNGGRLVDNYFTHSVSDCKPSVSVQPFVLLESSSEKDLKSFLLGEAHKKAAGKDSALELDCTSQILLVTMDWISDSIQAGKLVKSWKVVNLKQDDDHAPEKVKRHLDDSQPSKSDTNTKQTKKSRSDLLHSPHLLIPSSQIKYNELIVCELTKLLKRYTATGDTWRKNTYRKAINAIKKHGKSIESGLEAMKIPGIGDSIAKKVLHHTALSANLCPK